jgi:hypothetical protein
MRDAYELRRWTMGQVAGYCFRKGCQKPCKHGHTRNFWTVRAILRYARRNTQLRIE